jgi:hypothetical protein
MLDGAKYRLRQAMARPSIWSRLIAADRFVEAKLKAAASPAWTARYKTVRERIRAILA